ncbi:MAG: HIT domain-containing protein [Planctomycetota bacterium]|nr:HIT domain-containing protein [Planctomycetota bacterium]
MPFILAPKDPGCFFCRAAALKAGDEAGWKDALLLHRDRHALAIMNRYPYIGGHLLVAPLRHTSDFANLTPQEHKSMWELARRCVGLLEKTMRPQGHNLGMNLGKAAGAGVEAHLHLHVLPRWLGDTNFLPVVDGTHSIPVALGELWETFRPEFKRAKHQA